MKMKTTLSSFSSLVYVIELDISLCVKLTTGNLVGLDRVSLVKYPTSVIIVNSILFFSGGVKSTRPIPKKFLALKVCGVCLITVV